MKLWLIEYVGGFRFEGLNTAIVRAETEAQARELANKQTWSRSGYGTTDPSLFSCVELTAGGEPEVIATEVQELS